MIWGYDSGKLHIFPIKMDEYLHITFPWYLWKICQNPRGRLGGALEVAGHSARLLHGLVPFLGLVREERDGRDLVAAAEEARDHLGRVATTTPRYQQQSLGRLWGKPSGIYPTLHFRNI